MFNIDRIETKRLIARKITDDDFESLHLMHSNTTVMATLGGLRSVQQTRDNLQWNLNQWRDNGFGLWMWYDKSTRDFIGRAGLRVVNVTGQDEVEVGYALLPQYWNKGFTTEIARASVQVAFEKLHLQKLICFALNTNKASQRVMQKAGFHYVKDIVHANNPHVLYELYSDFYWENVITFKPLAKHHLNLLVTWFNKPHVKQWWNDQLSEEQIKQKYGARIGNKAVQPFIVYLHQKPIGFIQYYCANKMENSCELDVSSGVVGIDQFIGEENYINKGFGTQLIRQFIKRLFEDPSITKIITEVDVKNNRAYRCYQKVGFNIINEIRTHEVHELLLEISV